MEKITESRRKFIWQLIWLLVGGGLLGRYLLPTQKVAGEVLRVALAEVPHQGALVYLESRVALVREADKVIALNLVCTHLGCALKVTPDALVCPCHGSRFDHGGLVLEGPATRPLEQFVVNRKNDQLEVQLGPGRAV